MPEFHFSIANAADISPIHRLVNSAYRGESSKKGWTTEADFLDGIRVDEEALLEMMNNKDAVILKATKDNRIVGCVYLQKQNNQIYLGMLTVDPELQAKGLGKKFLEKAEEYAKEQQCMSIIMTVITLRKELIQWYERNGYYITGERKPFPNDTRFGIPRQPLEFLVMKKDLA